MTTHTDLEQFRGWWVARDRATSAVRAANADRLALVEELRRDPELAEQVFLHQVPLADEPLFVGLG